MHKLENPYNIPQIDQTDMLRKLALYWDGQWFLKTVEEFGLPAGIEINARVRASFGRIEMRTLLKTLKKKKAANLEEAMWLLQTYLDVFMGKRLRAEFYLVSEHEAKILVSRCAAFEGAKRAGLERSDQACIACEGLWSVWLDVLLPDNAIDIRIPMQQGKGASQCEFSIQTNTHRSLMD